MTRTIGVTLICLGALITLSAITVFYYLELNSAYEAEQAFRTVYLERLADHFERMNKAAEKIGATSVDLAKLVEPPPQAAQKIIMAARAYVAEMENFVFDENTSGNKGAVLEAQARIKTTLNIILGLSFMLTIGWIVMLVIILPKARKLREKQIELVSWKVEKEKQLALETLALDDKVAERVRRACALKEVEFEAKKLGLESRQQNLEAEWNKLKQEAAELSKRQADLEHERQLAVRDRSQAEHALEESLIVQDSISKLAFRIEASVAYLHTELAKLDPHRIHPASPAIINGLAIAIERVEPYLDRTWAYVI